MFRSFPDASLYISDKTSKHILQEKLSMKGELSSLLFSAMAVYLRMKKEVRFAAWYRVCHGICLIIKINACLYWSTGLLSMTLRPL